MPVASSPGIFLSYRRQDAAASARLLLIRLRERFPGTPVFLDLDSIEAGLEFAEVIREAIESCAVLVALIGHLTAESRGDLRAIRTEWRELRVRRALGRWFQDAESRIVSEDQGEQ